MNKIELDNCNGNILVDGKLITEYLDEYKNQKLSSDFYSYKGLLPAWNGELLSEWENDFIWELIETNESLNVPILVCEDDCDLSCIVILIHIRKCNDKIYWDRIGKLDHSNWSLEEEQKSGILYLGNYTTEDWKKYGDNIAKAQYKSNEYWKWISENYYEENIRRLRNYLKPYMQQNKNIEWIQELNWEFSLEEYRNIVEKCRKRKNNQINTI